MVPQHHTATTWLRQCVEDGLRWRFPQSVPTKARDLIEKELTLIADLGYESYFLTVHDLVRFARSRGILCQGQSPVNPPHPSPLVTGNWRDYHRRLNASGGR